MHVSPVLSAQTVYPFVRIEEAKRRKAAEGVRIFDFGMGDPREPTDARIQRALVDALGATAGYPASVGLPELRSAIAEWFARRFGVAVDPERELIPTYGSKEAIFTFALAVVDAGGSKDVVLVPEPGYPVYERGALFAHARVDTFPLLAENGFLPDLDALDWERAAILWLNYPNNPTGAVAPLDFYERVAELSLEHDVLVCSDEAYTELWFDEPPASAIQVRDRRNMVVFNTLSKRSSMTGYRSGFAAGDRQLIAALRRLRPSVGVTPQEFVQRASVAAWNDETHVEDTRARYDEKRHLFLELFERHGVHVAASLATFYLWVAVPDGRPSLGWALDLLERADVVVAPGSFFGPEGEGYVRIAMVPTLTECERAVDRLEPLLAEVPA